MTQLPDVLLVTRDPRLQATVAAARPSGKRLSMTGALDFTARTEQARHIWIDLQTATIQGCPDAQERLVYFTTAQQAPAAGWPVASCIAKPLRALTAEILWAGVSEPCTDRSATCNGTGQSAASFDQAGWLPAWTACLLTDSFPGLRRRIVEVVPGRLGYQRASLFLHMDDTPDMLLAESCGCGENAAEHGLLNLPFHLRQGTYWPSVRAADRWTSLEDEPAILSQPERLALPLSAGDALIGALELSAPTGARAVLSTTELCGLGQFLGGALHLARQLDESRREARVDALTGLYNYRWMRDTLLAELRRAERHRTPLALIALDMDNLKHVNDGLGHAAGDAALRALSARVSSMLRQFDSAARVGGDEFLVLLPATDLNGARVVAQRIQERLTNSSVTFNGRRITLSASMGITQSSRGDTLDSIIRAADLAMYAAKRKGGGQIECSAALSGAIAPDNSLRHAEDFNDAGRPLTTAAINS